MKKNTTTNTFHEGMVMDFNPLATPDSVLTNCLNGTIITYNGNENVLLNDMGNGRVETAYLPEGYIPIGTAELGGIIYIVSYNPLINKSQIGCFPSPERNISSDELLFSENVVTNSQFKNGGKIINTIVKVKLLTNSETLKLNPGDKYIIFSNNNGIINNKDTISDVFEDNEDFIIDNTPKFVTIHVVSIGEDGKITYLDDLLKWYDKITDDDDYPFYIKNFDSNSESDIKDKIDNDRTLTTSAYNIFNSNISGELALLFELKVIDTFSVTWNADIKLLDDSDLYDKSAEIKFNLEWTSSHPKINPKYVIITKSRFSENSEIESEISENFICEIPENTENKQISIVVDEFKYNSNNPYNIWHYQITPAMEFGELDYLAVNGNINLSDLDSEKTEISEWYYYIEEDKIKLNWKFFDSSKKNGLIKGIDFTFIPFDELESDLIITNEEDKDDPIILNYPNYKIANKPSYSGNLQEEIEFKNSSKLLNGELKKNYLYLVDIRIEYDTIYLHKHKWLYTTGLWNDEYLKARKGIGQFDFSVLSLDDLIKLEPELQVTDTIEESSYLSELSLPDSLPEESEIAYSVMGANIVTVNHLDNKFNTETTNLIVNTIVNQVNYSNLFKFEKTDNDYTYSTIYNNYITHDELIIESDKESQISEYVNSKFMDEEPLSLDLLNTTINDILENNVINSDNDNLLVDTFRCNTDINQYQDVLNGTLKVNVSGAIFSRINASLINKNITVSQWIRPILFKPDECEKFGFEINDAPQVNTIKTKKLFKEGHRDLGSGGSFSFLYALYNWDEKLITNEEDISLINFTENDNDKENYWNPNDNFLKRNYWDTYVTTGEGETGEDPYIQWLNPWMIESNSPFYLLQYGANFENESIINETYGRYSDGVVRVGHVDYNEGINKTLPDVGNKWGIWCKTNNNHFIPINTFNSEKSILAKFLFLMLMQVYYVDTSIQYFKGVAIEYINKLKEFEETWNIKFKTFVQLNNLHKNIKLNDISLFDLKEKCKKLSNSELNNISVFNYEINTSIGEPVYSHTFKINSDELYSIYEENKNPLYGSARDIITNSKTIFDSNGLNEGLLYIYNESKNKFLEINNFTYSVPLEGTIKNISVDNQLRFLLKSQSLGTHLSNDFIKCIKMTDDGKIVFDEDILLKSEPENENRILFNYYPKNNETKDHRGCYESNSKLSLLSS